jgi:uncharacterized protein
LSAASVVADTSGLCALLDRTSRVHHEVREIVTALKRPLIVPEPTLVELDHLSQRFGRQSFRLFLGDLTEGAFELHSIDEDDLPAMGALWDRYRDLDPGYTDLAVVRVAERLGTDRVLTLDARDFRVLRAGGRPFVLLPEDAGA